MTKFIYLTLLIMLFKPFFFNEIILTEYIDIIFEALNASVYLDEKYNIFGYDEYNACYEDFTNFILNFSAFHEHYPELIISNGKGVDDIGNEIECIGTNLFSEYLFFHIKTNETDKIIKTDEGLINYLDRNYLYLGFCIPKNCFNLTENIVVKMNNSNISIFNHYHNLTIKMFRRYDVDKNENSTPNIIFWFFIICLIIKLLVGIYIKFKYPKGYEIHGIKLYNDKRLLDNKNDDENEENLLKNKVNEKYDNNKLEDINIKGKYNPEFDYESSYPMYFRIAKYLDLFNNIDMYMVKRNRYFNDNDIDILCSIKALVLGYHILTSTIQALIRLPNTSVFNTEYYKSNGLVFYKRSINSFTFWIILESATFSFKLMKFIQKKIKNEENVSKNRQFNIVVSQSFKFLWFYIPKIISFIFIFIVFYYLFGYYTCGFEAKMTFNYINEEIIKKKDCVHLEKLWYSFIPFVNYKFDLTEEIKDQDNKKRNIIRICFWFSYIYSNMFFSSLFFIVILFILFYFQKKGIDIAISFLSIFGTIISYIYFFINNDAIFKRNKKGHNYKFYHFSGEKYCIFYPHVFFGYYYLGCILGFCLYYFNEQKYKKKENKSNKRKSLSKPKNNTKSKEEQEENEVGELYKPMEFCSCFIKSLKNTKNCSKIVFLFIYALLCFILSYIPFIIFQIKENEKFKCYKEKGIYSEICNQFKYEIFSFSFDDYYKILILKILYFFEKFINSILFFFFICILLVLPKNYMLIKIMKSSFFTPISRAGFFVTCIYESLIYILYCLFHLKVKIGFLVIIYIMIGFYAIIVTFCIYISILIEFPFRIIIKNCLRDDSSNKQNLQMILMKQI